MIDDAFPPFRLSDECRRAGTATPAAQKGAVRYAVHIPLFAAIAIAIAILAAGGALVFAAAAPVAALVYGRAAGSRHRRRRALWGEPFSEASERFLLEAVPHYRALDADGRELFAQRVKLFLAETAFHGAGVEANDRLRLLTAAVAVVPTLGFPEWEWRDLREVIFRPEGYDGGTLVDDYGVVTEFEESGMVGEEGVLSGVMMLSSEDLEWEFAHPEEGCNVGFHEFAHSMRRTGLLAMPGVDPGGWERILKKQRRLLARNLTLLDDYALVNGEELFASASELFFTIPHVFREWHRDLYALLCRAYRQRPHRWLPDLSVDPEPAPKRAVRKRRKKRSNS